jgi:ABC-type branched-subunit amino acid transport system ATPase component
MSQGIVYETRDLTVQYLGRIAGVEGLTMTVYQGETVAFVGTNGAGKTSALRALAGFLPREAAKITRGQVRLYGRDITGWTPQQVARLGVAMIPERDKVFVELTVSEHFRLAAGGRRPREYHAEVERVLALFPDLRPHLYRPAGYLSGGQRQMLAFAAAILRSPRVMLIDEFTQGLSPGSVAAVADAVRAIKSSGMTLVIVEQNVALARSLSDRLILLDGGHMVASGTPEELSLAEVTRTYLGVTSGTMKD